MAELTNLECKLGEVVGLAMAAQDATQKVIKLARDDGGNASALVTYASTRPPTRSTATSS